MVTGSKTLCRAHQLGDTMPLNLWTLCNSITQALELLETDSEHGDVATEGKASEDLEKNESEIEPIYARIAEDGEGGSKRGRRGRANSSFF